MCIYYSARMIRQSVSNQFKKLKFIILKGAVQIRFQVRYIDLFTYDISSVMMDFC